MKSSGDVNNISVEGTVPQISDASPSFCFSGFFKHFYKTKTKTYRNNLRHGSLHLDLNFMSIKFQ